MVVQKAVVCNVRWAAVFLAREILQEEETDVSGHISCVVVDEVGHVPRSNAVHRQVFRPWETHVVAVRALTRAEVHTVVVATLY